MFNHHPRYYRFKVVMSLGDPVNGYRVEIHIQKRRQSSLRRVQREYFPTYDEARTWAKNAYLAPTIN